MHGGITLAGGAAGKAALAVLCLAALALAVPSTARAEGGLFGALIRLFTGAPPSPPSERAPPRSGWDETPAKPRTESGGGAAYCVRTCDGRYFPIGRTSGGATPAATCRSMCPAAETRIYRGGSIDNAVAGDGSHYSSLANAYLYRQRLVGGCTCNGTSPAGNAAITIENDPTLRAGDIVMTANGPMVFTGSGGPPHRMSDFVPARTSRKLSAATRAQVMAMKVQRRHTTTANEAADQTAAKRQPPPADAFDFLRKPGGAALSYSEP